MIQSLRNIKLRIKSVEGTRKITHAMEMVAAAKLRGVLAKDLTKVPDHELQPHLAEWTPAPHRAGEGG